MEFSLVELIAVAAINIVSLVLAISVFSNNKKSSVGQFFLTLVIIILIWIDTGYLSTSYLKEFFTLLTKINVGIIPILFIFAFEFIHDFISRKRNQPIHYLVVISGVFLSIFTIFTNLVIQGVNLESWGTVLVPGTFSLLYYIWVGLMVLVILYILFRQYGISDKNQKDQIKFFLLGLLLFGFFNIIFNIIIPIFVEVNQYYKFGDYSVILFIGFTAYAIVKYHLFNVKVIATVTAVIAINIILIVQILTSQTAMDGLLKALFEVLVFYGSYILVQSVQREIKQKEELQVLSTQLTQANAHLKELDSMKTEFVSLASHELLTPVSAIEGYLSMMLDEHLAKVDDPTAARYLDRIYKSSRRLARLIADMLNISRIEEGRLLVEKKDVDLSELIKQVIDEIKFKAEEKKQKVIFDNPGAWKTYADMDKIKEVVVNLIGNSIKYSKEPGEIHIIVKKVPTVMVTSTWTKIENDIKGRPLDDQEAINSAVDKHYKEIIGPEQLLIVVKDQGIGIPGDELPRLFKKFHRVGDYSTAESQGTGLGLYISRALVELHHGRIWADSEGSGKGSTFTFSLPDISEKDNIIGLEKQINQDKEQLKPLAKPMNSKHEEQI